MKKIIAILTLSTVLALAGCNNQTQDLPEVSKAHVRVTSTVATVTRPEETESESIPETTEEVIEQREGTTFRNTIWGDDIDTIKKYETKINLESLDDGSLFGNVRVNGYKAFAFYHFNDNKLHDGLYLFDLGYTSGGQFISTYNSLKESLTKKYGNPTHDKIIPYQKESLIEYAGSSKALEYGYVSYAASWETDDTLIILGLSSQNYEIGLTLQYLDKNYEPDINDSGL